MAKNNKKSGSNHEQEDIGIIAFRGFDACLSCSVLAGGGNAEMAD